MARPIKRIAAEADVVKKLRRRAWASTSTVREQERAEIVLARIDGLSVTAAAERLGTTPKRVSMWTKRFEEEGLAGLEDQPGRGRPPSIPEAKVERVITEATRPPKPRTRWSLRSMAKHAGVSATTVHRIWSRNELKPHIVKTFKLSNDPKFEEKFWDVIGLYLDPPDKALVLCCADLTADVIRAGSFGSVRELVRDIEAYLKERNQSPRPYTWKADGAAILAKIKRARAALEKAEAG
jgi:transposase